MPVPGDGKEPGEPAWLRDPVSVLSAIEGGFLGPSLRLIAIGSRKIKITCRCPLSPRFFPVSVRGVFARSRIPRTPPQASPKLSQLYHREGFPPAAGGRTCVLSRRS